MRIMKGLRGIVTAVPFSTTLHWIAVSSVRCLGTLEFGRIGTKLRVILEHSPEGKETSGFRSSAQPFHFLIAQGEEEEWHCGLWAHKHKNGEVFVSFCVFGFFPFLTHYRVRGRRGEYLKLGKDSLLKECTEKLRASVESQMLKLLLSGSYFLKVNFELW